MDSDVLLQIAFVSIRLGAKVALHLHRLCVHRVDVPLKVARLQKTLAAFFAFK